jgi:methyl-accepting chemotaxis protein
MAARTRNRWYIDPQVQGLLVWRGFAYWISIVAVMASLLLLWNACSAPDRSFSEDLQAMWSQYQLPLLAAMIILPLFLLDIVKISNRFTGPVARFRKALRALSHGEAIQLLHFRADDCWQELAEDFNAVAARVQFLERQLAQHEVNAAKVAASEQHVATPVLTNTTS